MRSASVAPDLSSASSRVSDTVSTAIFSGTNCLLSSIPGMARTTLAVMPALVDARRGHPRLRDTRLKTWMAGTSQDKPGHDAKESSESLNLYSCAEANVLQLCTVPERKPVLNQRWRCSDEPWVKLSGT